MLEKLLFVSLMFDDLKKNMNIYMACEKAYKKEREDYEKAQEKDFRFYPINSNDQNKNHGKYALKRKIVYLRQELLNLERMLDDGKAD